MNKELAKEMLDALLKTARRQKSYLTTGFSKIKEIGDGNRFVMKFECGTKEYEVGFVVRRVK